MNAKAIAVPALIVFGPLIGAAGPGAPKIPEKGSALARLAAGLKPGTWAVLNKDGDDSGYGQTFTDSGIGGLFGYASKATYDPARRRVFFFGSGHHGRSTPEYYAEIIKFVVYEVDRNR